MAFFYASWTGHGAPTSSATEHTLFRITGAVAASTSANLIAIINALWAGHVASSTDAAKRAFSSITGGGNASTRACYTIWQVSVHATSSTILLAVIGIALEVASPTSAD